MMDNLFILLCIGACGGVFIGLLILGGIVYMLWESKRNEQA